MRAGQEVQVPNAQEHIPIYTGAHFLRQFGVVNVGLLPFSALIYPTPSSKLIAKLLISRVGLCPFIANVLTDSPPPRLPSGVRLCRHTHPCVRLDFRQSPPSGSTLRQRISLEMDQNCAHISCSPSDLPFDQVLRHVQRHGDAGNSPHCLLGPYIRHRPTVRLCKHEPTRTPHSVFPLRSMFTE